MSNPIFNQAMKWLTPPKMFSAVITLALVAGVLAWIQPSQARDTSAPALKEGNFPLVLAADLPKEARETLSLIRKGGPFPYSKDGVTFGNREKALPKQPRGFYHEYTVKTPGAKNRGTRRIVCGGNQTSGDCFYTDNHYESFRKIKE